MFAGERIFAAFDTAQAIASVTNAHTVLGAVHKHPARLFEADKPWEPRIDNGYPNVISCGGDAIAGLAGLSPLHVSGASHHSVSSLPCIAPTRPHPLWCPPRRAPRAPLPVLGPFRAAPLPRRALC